MMWSLALVVLLGGPALTFDDAGSKEAVAAAKELLSRELEVGEDEIAVRKVIATEWPDASLGCPAKDKSYAQVVTPGHRVLLEVRGKVYPVHTGQGRTARCDQLRRGPKLPEKTTQE